MTPGHDCTAAHSGLNDPRHRPGLDAVLTAPPGCLARSAVHRLALLSRPSRLLEATNSMVPRPRPRCAPPAEKDRQKGIIIGRGGSALKQLSTASRVEIEEFLGRPVYLNLSVKVREGWRKDAAQLERLGY